MKELVSTRFPALRSRDFRLLWGGMAISIVGSQMQFWAINWHVYALTRSPLALGLIGLSRLVPILIFSLIGGAVADSVDRRRVMLVTQSVMAMVATTLALLTYSGQINILSLYLLTALGAAAAAFDGPARQSLVPNLVPREHFPNAAALNSTIHQVATIVGPVTAGLLIGKGNLALTYELNALSFGAVLLALLKMHYRGERDQRGNGQGFRLSDIREGLAFVWRTPILVWTMFLDFLATFFSSANALLPIFAKDILAVGAQGYGVLAAAPAVGSLLTAITLSSLPPIHRQGWVLLGAVFAYGLATIIFGLSEWFWLSLIALGATGAADTVSTIIRHTLRQIVAPDHLRGRVTSVSMVFFIGGPQLGEFEAGVVANWIGAQGSVIVGGLGCALCVLWITARVPVLRQYIWREGEEDSGAKE